MNVLKNNVNDFIGSFFIEDLSLCDDLIKFFKENKQLQAVGNVGKIQNDTLVTTVDTKIKDSIDINFKSNSQLPIFLKYTSELRKVVDKYKKIYPFCDQYAVYGLYEDVNLQYYQANKGAFHKWHTERLSALSSRHLVFMTYLNDVKKGGETEFYHQKLKIKPKKGLTLIWPTDWTHTHRGKISKEDKYIMTGWLSFSQ